MLPTISREEQQATRLPFELLLEVLEWGSIDEASQRGAAYLAQSCRALRTSEAGKRARYAHALGVLSVSPPSKLPTKLDYEIQVLLESSTWPRKPPAQRAPLSTSERVAEAHVRGGEYFALSLDRRNIHCYTSESQTDSTKDLSAVQLEASVLRKTIYLGANAASCFAVDEEAEFCVIVYGDAMDESCHVRDASYPQSIEVRSLRTGDLALPGLQATLDIDVSSGRRIDKIEMLGDHLLFKFIFCQHGIEVRRWRTSLDDAKPFPIVYSRSAQEGEIECSSYLFAPNYLSVQTRTTTWQDPGAGTDMYIHQLRHDSAQHLATFKFPDYGHSMIQTRFACGARVEAGQNGLCMIIASGYFWLLELSVLVDLLASAAESGKVRMVDAEWIADHTHKLELPKNRENVLQIELSGWRCVSVLMMSPRLYRRGRDNPPFALQFLEVSPARPTGKVARSASEWRDRTVRVSEHNADDYSKPEDEREIDLKLAFGGNRLLVLRHPGRDSDAIPGWSRYLMSSWRL